MDDQEYEAKIDALEAKLKPELTDEFLSLLIKAAKTCGWSVDHIEAMSFIEWCFEVAGKECPKDLVPF